MPPLAAAAPGPPTTRSSFTPEGAGPNATLKRVPAAGGAPAAFGTLGQGALTQRWPQVLPGGTRLLYTEHSAAAGFDTANLVVAPLSGGAPTIVLRGGYYGRYLSSQPGALTAGRASPQRSDAGHLIYMNQGTLFAVPFDLDRLTTLGPAVPAIEGIATNAASFGGAQLATSTDGTIIYVPGGAATSDNSIDWMTRDGKTSVLRAAKAAWGNPRFSPDGQKLAIDIFDGKQHDIWVYEWARDSLTQLTFDPGSDRGPIWTPDGRRMAFRSDRAKRGVTNLYWVNADGTGEVSRLTDSPDSQRPYSWHPSGKFLAFGQTGSSTTADVMILPLEGDAAHGWTPGTPTAFLSTPARRIRSDVLAGWPLDRVQLHRSGRQQPRCLRVSVSWAGWKMAHLHIGRRLSSLVDPDARAAVHQSLRPGAGQDDDGVVLNRRRCLPRRDAPPLVADERPGGGRQ